MAATQNRDMGSGSIPRLLAQLALPAVVAQVVNLLYNIVDRIYIGHMPEVGASALTGVGLFTPILMLITAFAMLCGSGGAPRAAIAMGRGDDDAAEKIMGNCFTLLLILAAVLTVVFYFAAPSLLVLFGASEKTLPYALDYARIYIIGTIFVLIVMGMNPFVTTQGFATFSMMTTVIGAVCNIILDPIFIFGYCGEALSGTTGAAVATVIGQFCGAGMTLFFNLNKNPDIQIGFKGFRPSAKAIGRIYAVGLPSIAMQCVGSVMTFGMNLILMTFSATAVAVFGVYFKLQSFVFMPVFGLNNGMVPIISYNYGARRPDRVKKTIKLAVCYAEGIMLIGFCIFQFFPDKVLGIFAASDAMLAIGIPALRIICPHFLLAGASIVLSSVFQALGNGIFSLIVSVCRQLFVLLPAAWLLAQTGNVNNVWWAFLIAEVVSLLLSLAFFARINKTVIAPLYGPEEP